MKGSYVWEEPRPHRSITSSTEEPLEIPTGPSWVRGTRRELPGWLSPAAYGVLLTQTAVGPHEAPHLCLPVSLSQPSPQVRAVGGTGQEAPSFPLPACCGCFVTRPGDTTCTCHTQGWAEDVPVQAAQSCAECPLAQSALMCRSSSSGT